MDVSKIGNISTSKFPGNISVKGDVKTKDLTVENDLKVENNVDIQGTLSVNDIVINGKSLSDTLNESLNESLNLINEKQSEINNNLNKDCIYLGNRLDNGSWRLKILNGELLIEKLEDGVWNIKQSIE